MNVALDDRCLTDTNVTDNQYFVQVFAVLINISRCVVLNEIDAGVSN